MQTMKANVFRGPNKIGIEEVPRPSAGVGEVGNPNHVDDNLRDRFAHITRRIPGKTWTGDRSRTGRRD
jgi:hypothetical protein